MAEPDFIIKQNDFGEWQPLRATLEQLKVDEDGKPELVDGKEVFEPIDLTGCTVTMRLRGPASGTEKTVLTDPLTLIDAANGRVEHQWEKAEGEEPPDTAVPGDYKLEFKIAKTGNRRTVPTVGAYHLLVEVEVPE